MDGSASMNATDVPPTRLDAAKSAASTFLDELPERFRVGLVSFSDAVTVLEEPTEDREAVQASLDGIGGEVGTAIGEAIREAVDLAPRDENGELSRDTLFAVLLLSDGTNTSGVEPSVAVDEVKDTGIPIYTIALGTEAGTVDVPDAFGELRTIEVPPDPEALRQIAEETGGQFFEAPTEADLQAVYEQIGSQVTYEDEKRELTAAFAGAGAIFLLIGASLSALWFGRLP
jgi:Ca-activated chloride channel family protein